MPPQLIQVGEVELDLARYELRCAGRRIRLERQPMELLILLARKPGDLVGREEIIAQLWGEGVFLDAEQGVNNCIRKIRLALHDDAERPRYIETVVGKGYRLIAPQRAAAPPLGTSTAPPRPRWAASYFLMGTILLALVVAAGAFFLLRPRDPIESLAVLPFENVGHDPDSEYLSDGITESIINGLSGLPNLRVMSRSAVFRYKGKQIDPQKAGRELHVGAVVTGRLVRQGESLNVSVELVKVSDGSALWGEHYTRSLGGLVDLQSEIARNLSAKLRLRLSDAESKRFSKSPTQNPEAYQLYLKGRYFWRKFTPPSTKKGIEYFLQAIEKDPTYAQAYAGLADSYALGSVGGGAMSPNESMPQAKTAAIRALELDNTVAEAHMSLALVETFYDWDWANAEKEFKRAIELDPNYSEAHHFYSHFFMATGRIPESLSESKLALQLDPLSPDLTWHLGWHYLYARQYDEAIEQLQKTFELDPNSAQAHLMLGFAYGQKKMFNRAIVEFQKARSLVGDGPFALADLGYTYAVSGNRDGARRILDNLAEMAKHRYVSPYNQAVISAGLGEKDQAFAWLQKSYEDHSYNLNTVKVDPRFDTLRSDPRFDKLLHRMRLSP